MLANKILLERMQVASAYAFLRVLRIFILFLKTKQIVQYSYQIPQKFMGKAGRSNAYVPEQDIIALLQAIYNRLTKIS